MIFGFFIWVVGQIMELLIEIEGIEDEVSLGENVIYILDGFFYYLILYLFRGQESKVFVF